MFTATFSTPFIREDLTILRSRYRVTEVISSGPMTFFRYLSMLRSVDCTFSWFASVYSSLLVFLTKLFGVKSILILGGVDVAREPSYHYGIWNSRWKSRLVRYGITHADAVLAVDPSLKSEAMRLCGYDGGNISVVPTGYDAKRWTPSGAKSPRVLSIGIAETLPRFMKKGFDRLFAAAALMKDVEFTVIGISDEVKKQCAIPPNVRCISSVPQDELLEHYRTSKVFCLLSRHEGLPNVLCEAMLCECVPVGSNVYGIPNGIGNAGYIVNPEHMEQIVSSLRSALQSDDAAGAAARQRIVSEFPLDKRKNEILSIVSTVLS